MDRSGGLAPGRVPLRQVDVSPFAHPVHEFSERKRAAA